MARTTTRRANRRSFLRGLLTLGGVATAMGGARAVRSAAPQEGVGPAPRAAEGAGYRLTPHVRRYYETAAR